MKYLFKHITGQYVIQGNTITKFDKNKHARLSELPEKLLLKALKLLHEIKPNAALYTKNLAKTKQDISKAVSANQLIIQTISNIEELNKTANLLTKRLREWYGLYLPEISEFITKHEHFIELVLKSKKELMQQFTISATMGGDLEKKDVEEIRLLAVQIQQLHKLREQHEKYLESIMKKHCPNVLELAGATIGAKLLELAKGLKKMAMLPSSTIQLLGAEKALFRHLKTGARSPKYGVLFEHQIVQNVARSMRGKAARMLADKISLCARLDYFKGEFKAKEYRKELEKVLG